MLNPRFSCLALSLLLAAAAAAPCARASESVTLSWNRNLETNVSGYRVHYGTAATPYNQLVDVKSPSATINNLAPGATYTFAVSAYNSDGAESVYSAPLSYTVPGGSLPTLDNISSRLLVLTGDNVMIGGFIVQTTTPKKIVLRGLGPSLADAGVKGTLADPVLELRDSTGALVASNDDWKSSSGTELTALGIAPTNPHEAAIVATLPAGVYSAVVHGKGSATGVALFELYNLDRTVGAVANISTRGRIATGDNVMIGGFIIGGTGPSKIIVRGIGPSLLAAGVPDALVDPTLELYDGNGTLLSSNDNWRTDQQSEVTASGVAPTDDRESAIVATLNPGVYSAVVRGKNNTSGVGLIEVYALAP